MIRIVKQIFRQGCHLISKTTRGMLRNARARVSAKIFTKFKKFVRSSVCFI